MTPFDKDDDEFVDIALVPKPAPTDPGAPAPAPVDPGDAAMWNVIVSRYENKLYAYERRIEKQSAEIHALQAELHEQRERERIIRDEVELERRADTYRRLHAMYHEGPGGVNRCDCTTGRGDLIQRALGKVFGEPGA